LITCLPGYKQICNYWLRYFVIDGDFMSNTFLQYYFVTHLSAFVSSNTSIKKNAYTGNITLINQKSNCKLGDDLYNNLLD